MIIRAIAPVPNTSSVGSTELFPYRPRVQLLASWVCSFTLEHRHTQALGLWRWEKIIASKFSSNSLLETVISTHLLVPWFPGIHFNDRSWASGTMTIPANWCPRGQTQLRKWRTRMQRPTHPRIPRRKRPTHPRILRKRMGPSHLRSLRKTGRGKLPSYQAIYIVSYVSELHQWFKF